MLISLRLDVDAAENVVTVSLKMVLDGDELLEVPYIGERLKKSSSAFPTARGTCVRQVLSSQISPGLALGPLAMGDSVLLVLEQRQIVYIAVGSPSLTVQSICTAPSVQFSNVGLPEENIDH